MTEVLMDAFITIVLIAGGFAIGLAAYMFLDFRDKMDDWDDPWRKK